MQYTGIFENDLDFQAIVSEITAERTSEDESEVDSSYYLYLIIKIGYFYNLVIGKNA
jgi:hypothetical protein